jgi:peptidoglycan/LPS O-acetylase OafA/YrhL
MMTWVVVGLVLQIAMVVAGHLVPPLRDWWGPGGMLISLVVGALAAPSARGSWSKAVVNGALAGGVGAFVGILVAVLLHDVPVMLLVLGTVSSVVAGIIGAAIMNAVRRGRSSTA